MLFRLVALLCLLVLALLPTEGLYVFMKSEVQLLVATFSVAILVLYDVYAGLILCLGLVVLYYRLYGHHTVYLDNAELRDKGPMANLVTKFLTPEHLKSAQNNVVNEADYDSEIVGIDGMYGKSVYGAQGMDITMPGLERPHTLTGEVVDGTVGYS
jgi:hypothetical protein